MNNKTCLLPFILLYSNGQQTHQRELKIRLSILFMNDIIITTPEQLQTIVGQAVEAIIPRLAEHQRKANEKPTKENLTMVEAIEYLNGLGFPTTRSAIYNLVFKGKIPHRKIGKRIVFSRAELTEWVESRTQRIGDESIEMRQRIARSANRKLK